MFSICNAYASLISCITTTICSHLLYTGVFCHRYLIVVLGICSAYLVHAVAKGKLWLQMRVLFGQKCSTADLLPVAPSVTTPSFSVTTPSCTPTTVSESVVNKFAGLRM